MNANFRELLLGKMSHSKIIRVHWRPFAILVFLLCNSAAQIIPEPGEPLIPTRVTNGGKHKYLHFPEPRTGLLQDAVRWADLDPKFFHNQQRNSFWESLAFRDAHRELVDPGSTAKPHGAGVFLFFCTCYFTVQQSAFKEELGFDMVQQTFRGLGGRKYGRAFLKASKMEGFGRLDTPVGGKRYIKYDGRWGYANRILGNRNNTLVARRSAAVHRRSPLFRKKGTRILFLDPQIHNVFGSIEWRSADTGFGLSMSQIDLYWGEDDPTSASSLSTPAGTAFGKMWVVPVVIE